MPSPTTTTVTIGSILDLIGPTSPSTGNNDDQSGFDSLLQATQAPPPPPPTPVDSPPSAASDSRATDRNQPPATNQSATNDRPASNSNQDHESSQPTPTPAPAPAASAADKDSANHPEPEHAREKSDDQAATEQIIAQSLAGLPNTPKNTPAQVLPSTDATAEDAPSDAAKTIASQAANSPHAKTANQQPNVATADAQVQAKTETNTDSLQVSGKAPTSVVAATLHRSAPEETIAKPQAADKLDTITKDDKDQPQTGDPLTTTDLKLTSDDKPQPQTTQVKHDQSPATDASQLTLDVSAMAAPSTDGTNSQASAATPLVAPITNALPMTDQPGPAQSNNPSATTAIGVAPSRSRLPAQALVPAANTGARHAPLEVDASRLISRVVRAFSAAEERDGEVRLRLSPPELGSIRLDVRVENGALTAHMQTETDAARLAIIDNLPTLRDRLAEQGVRIERFDVDLMQRQPGGMPDQPGGRQPDMPEAPLRFPPPSQSTATAPAPVATGPSPSLGSASGLNVVI
jgi:flagellar hook-length control protein FliK